MPENLQIIRENAFYGCSSIKSLTIPSSVELIYQGAFAGCSSLATINAMPTEPPFLYDNSFSKYTVPLKVPKGCKDAYKTASGWKNFTYIIDTDKYKLTYMVGDKVYKSQEIEEGSFITPEAEPNKEGYTFSGWNEIPKTMPSHDVTVTGGFSINKYKLAYKLDDNEYKSFDVEFGADITSEADPTKEGYTFSGWSLIPETMPANDVTVTGSFTFVDAIDDVIAEDDTYEIYTLDGKQVETLQKGVNIIKYKKGSTQKVFVK